MNLHIATPRTSGRRQRRGPYMALAAGILFVAGATAGAVSLRGGGHSAKTSESVAASQVTTFAGAGRIDTRGGYADYLQSQRPVVTSVGYGPSGIDDVPPNAQTVSSATTPTGATDARGGYGEYLRDTAATSVDPSIAAELSDLSNLQAQVLNGAAQPVAATESAAAPSVASQIEGPGPHFIPGPGADTTVAADSVAVIPAAPEAPR